MLSFSGSLMRRSGGGAASTTDGADYALLTATRLSVVMPSFFMTTSPGALMPKRSTLVHSLKLLTGLCDGVSCD
ncbi:hypothetical protein BH11VER1_BH11VER1_38120 [soil metagenome]